jgi:hypothetical protein
LPAGGLALSSVDEMVSRIDLASDEVIAAVRFQVLPPAPT